MATANNGAVKLDKLAADIDALRRAQRLAAKHKATADSLKAKIQDAMGDAEIGTVNGQNVVRYPTTARTQLDTKAIKLKHPEIAAACSKIVTVRTFQLIDPTA